MPSLRIAHERHAALQHRSRGPALARRGYRDGERRPRLLRHRANRRADPGAATRPTPGQTRGAGEMNVHERSHLQHHAFRHARLLREAEVRRALRGGRAPGVAHGLRRGAATALRALAARLEPRGHGRLA